MDMETPNDIKNRVLHEKEIPPGTICRKHWHKDEEKHSTAWFLVLSEPQRQGSIQADAVQILWLEGDKKYNRDRYFLADLGVHPPHRAVCEKHELQLPEQYICNSKILQRLNGIIQKLRR